MSEQLIPLAKAQAEVKRLQDALVPYCSTIGVVGSVRRKKRMVHDVELCCIPNMDEVPGLFETLSERSAKFIHEVKHLGEILKGDPATGRYVQIKISNGIVVDLFIPQPQDYYRQYAIRTGSAKYSAYVVAQGWRALGWCGTDHGLRREEYCIHDGNGWKWVNKDPDQELPPHWKSEREFFEWLKVPFREPDYREVWI